MARINSALLNGATGKIGNLVFFTRNGKTYARAASQGSKGNTASEAQVNVYKKFGQGIAYAKHVLTDPELKRRYERRKSKGISAYNLAVRDACLAPVIEHINAEGYKGKPGDEIVIRATDDFMVRSVSVMIVDADGGLIEEGGAIDSNRLNWVYSAKVAHEHVSGCKILVVAKDFPGNKASLEITIKNE